MCRPACLSAARGWRLLSSAKKTKVLPAETSLMRTVLAPSEEGGCVVSVWRNSVWSFSLSRHSLTRNSRCGRRVVGSRRRGPPCFCCRCSWRGVSVCSQRSGCVGSSRS